MAVFEIHPSVKNYAWGKLGFDSAVAKLCRSAYPEFEVGETTPYAELWMGTHISGPSTIPSKHNMTLLDWLRSNHESLGPNIINIFGETNGLPFLFKVLSIDKPLSIQVHPDKKTAIALHKESREHYPDNNHKPELAIALTDFEALCGFRPLQEILFFFTELPQLSSVIGDDLYQNFLSEATSAGLKTVFKAFMTCKEEVFQPLLSDLVEHFKDLSLGSKLSKATREHFLSLTADYPDDIGCFCLFFLNYLKLSPGEAIFLAANEPHAYLKGNCVECMARSDNVVRAGLTPKFKDVETLCDILSYKCKTAKDNLFLPEEDPSNPHIKTFNPPVEDFSVDQINIPKEDESYKLPPVKSAALLLIVEGAGMYKYEGSRGANIIPGIVLFIPSETKLKLELTEDILMFRAYVRDVKH